MGSMTAATPKPMLTVQARPTLAHLRLAGISRFLIVIGFQGNVIKQHFEKTNPDLEFVRQNPRKWDWSVVNCVFLLLNSEWRDIGRPKTSPR
jgi:NDP-sugar pyrophosphorylase family protein